MIIKNCATLDLIKMSDQENQENQGKEAKKVLANFESVKDKLIAIMNGPDNLKIPNKVKKDDMESIIKELFKEENEATVKEVKEGVKNLLKGYVTLNASLAEERKKLDALEIAKKKEFNATAARLFARIEGIDALTKEYQDALGAAGKAIGSEGVD